MFCNRYDYFRRFIVSIQENYIIGVAFHFRRRGRNEEKGTASGREDGGNCIEALLSRSLRRMILQPIQQCPQIAIQLACVTIDTRGGSSPTSSLSSVRTTILPAKLLPHCRRK